MKRVGTLILVWFLIVGMIMPTFAAETAIEKVETIGIQLEGKVVDPDGNALAYYAVRLMKVEAVEEPAAEEPTEPVVEEPAAEEPTEPVVEEPAVEEPAEPADEEPAAADPTEAAVEEPAAAEPAVEEQVAAEPTEAAVEEPAVEELAEPVVEEPAVEELAEPVVEEPAVEELAEPVVEEPAVEEPAEPAIEEPAAAEPTEPVVEELAAAEPTEPVAEEPVEASVIEPQVDFVLIEEQETDAEGGYVFLNLEAGLYQLQLLVEDEWVLLSEYRLVDDQTVVSECSFSIVMEEWVEDFGVLTDGRTGNGIANPEIRFTELGTHEKYWFTGDEEGRFDFRVPAGHYEILIHCEGYFSTAQEVWLGVEEADDEEE